MEQKLALGLKDAAAAVGLSPWTLRGWIRSGKLRCVRLGRRVMVEPAELQRLVEQGRSFSVCSELSEQATQWFNDFNARYFDNRLPEFYVEVHYGWEECRPLTDHNGDVIHIYGAWEDAGIVNLLLREMANISTVTEQFEILERERLRLKEAGAPFTDSCGLRLRSRKPDLEHASNATPGEHVQ